MLQETSRQTGKDERHRAAKDLFKERPSRPATQLEKTTAAAKEILILEAEKRAEKSARLKAAREARDRADKD